MTIVPVMPGPKKKPSGERKNLTVRLPAATVERLKQTARMAAGHPTFSTVTSIVTDGINHELDRIEAVLAATYKDLDSADSGAQQRGSPRVPVVNNHASRR